MTDNLFDVVVLGRGPAAAECALLLRRNDFRVLCIGEPPVRISGDAVPERLARAAVSVSEIFGVEAARPLALKWTGSGYVISTGGSAFASGIVVLADCGGFESLPDARSLDLEYGADCLPLVNESFLTSNIGLYAIGRCHSGNPSSHSHDMGSAMVAARHIAQVHAAR